jgi:hypothetical protein
MRKTSSLLLFLLIISSGILSFLSSSRSEVREPEINYRSCTQLQKRMNKVNNPLFKFAGFERANLGRRMYAHNEYMVYCNGGTIVDREEKTVCKGYIAYSYDPTIGTANYYGDWGWTDGTPNGADGGKRRYCQLLGQSFPK